MQGGDISNGTPKRVLVHLDVVVGEATEREKVLWLIPVTRTRHYYDLVALNRLWLFTSRAAVNLEVFDVGCDDEDMARVMDDIDRMGTNPFKWATAYEDVPQLVRTLPYRPEVAGVIDLPERAFTYGSKYMDLGMI